MLRGYPLWLIRDALILARTSPRSHTNPGQAIALDAQQVYVRHNLEIPSGGGVGTARAIAHAVQRLRDRRTRAGIAAGDTGFVGRRGGAPDARVLRRVPMKGDGAQEPLGFMEADASLAVWQPRFVRGPWRGWFAGLCGFVRRDRYAYITNRRSARNLLAPPCDVGAQRWRSTRRSRVQRS